MEVPFGREVEIQPSKAISSQRNELTFLVGLQGLSKQGASASHLPG